MRKLFTGALAIGAASAMMMTAFAGEVTVDDVLAKYAEASASMQSFTSTAAAMANVSISVPDADTSIAVSGEMALDMACTTDPLTISVTGSANADLMGEAMAMNMEMYMVPEEDTLAVYAKVGEEGGEAETVKTVIDAEQTAQILALMQGGSMEALTSLPIEFTLEDGVVEKCGVDCYSLKSTVTAEDIPAILSYAMDTVNKMSPEAASELPSEDELSMVSMLATGLQLNVEIDVDAETYLPIYAKIDMDGSDYSMLGTLFASMQGLTKEDGSMYEVNISAEPLFLEYVYAYPESLEIEVPAEIIENAQEVDASAIEDAVAEVAE